MHCIICGEKTENIVCPVCGFDASRCAELYPTFSKELDLGEAIWEYRYKCWSNRTFKAPSTPTSSFEMQIHMMNPLNKTIAVGSGWNNNYVIGIKPDGSVVSAGFNTVTGSRAFSAVASAISVAAGTYHAVCLLSDGTVVARGDSRFGQCDVRNWSEDKAIGAGYVCTVGLRFDGTVLGCGELYNGKEWTTSWQEEINNWKDIVYITSGCNHIVGMRRDGSAFVCGNKLFFNISKWKKILSLAIGDGFAIGLCSDGTVEKTLWAPDISILLNNRSTALAAGQDHVVGLREDGTVVIADKKTGSKTLSWTDVVSVAAGDGLTAGLRKDGAVLITGKSSRKLSEVKNWRLRVP